LVASSNSFYSSLYAKLYKELMEHYDFMKEIFDNNLQTYTDLFDIINYCNPDEDYSKFCEYNKENDTRKATSKFYINLMKEEVLEKDIIMELIIKFQARLNKYISKNDKGSEVEELSENISIMVLNGYDVIKNEEDWYLIYENITSMSKLNAKDYPSISNKIIFKHMDLLESFDSD
jgi:hypothetical protein